MYQRIKDAWVDDGKIHVKVKSMGNIILTPADIRQAVMDHPVRSAKTKPMKQILCRNIKGKLVDIDAINGHQESLKKHIKEARKMGKTVKVEFRVRRLSNQKNIEVNNWSDEMEDAIVKSVGESFKAFCSVKPGEKDNEDIISMVASMESYTPKSESAFFKRCHKIARILDVDDGYEYIDFQEK